ncbi:MAG: type IIA DNA topoisomerase subunit B [Runella slithyformis]|nr:MAG: type IIA DNA topoisomerase subunit B [Runella slithyformis]TAF97225.1 MAG: type IIA DNA topoisomerase subunit B [Runella sp.]TAG21944.1 MAG: type IIA DNA topoisomerase subunit B [Cytophagales bacterium]TAG41188.1 MAG: type IIA DNA topoisomerase subunit B [Cytophagia bacterium]TAF29018.1 MAG: type IIA DNA topoisomerase subunit B [Runella slithyformis]
MAETVKYDESSIRSLDWKEHIRLRPGMYIGKLGDGAAADDGIYVLVKEIMDNSIDEHTMGFGKNIDIKISEHRVEIRDNGRGIPLGKVVDCVSKINTGGKYDSGAFQKSVGLNGVGTKAVNALSNHFRVQSFRDGKTKWAEFEKGELINQSGEEETTQKNGTLMVFEPDNTIFKNYHFIPQFLDNLIWNYCYLNAGLIINFNGQKFVSQNGLLDLLRGKAKEEDIRYPIIHLKGADIEIAMTHGNQYGEEYYSFVNGQYTTQGGTHLMAFRQSVVDCVREHFGKDYAVEDVRASIVAAVSIRVQEPVFESQTKTKLGSSNISPDPSSLTIRTFINDFIKSKLDNYLHMNPAVKEALKKRIEQSERERKELSGIRKLANERAKKANLHNKKLRDCRAHLIDLKNEDRFNTTLFITEGDSASGSITKARNVQTQAVFSLRGKPLNCFGMTKKVVYENEEFNLLQHALDIEDGMETLRYNRIVISTDADVDGMHIRLLMLTFFLQFFPDLVRNGHVYVLQTPLFRIRNPRNHKETIYCYSDEERQRAIKKLGGNKRVEITRFKGLGEISPDEFGRFIGEDMRLEPVILDKDATISKILTYFMGKNTPERQRFIIDNLRIEKDILDLDNVAA